MIKQANALYSNMDYIFGLPGMSDMDIFIHKIMTVILQIYRFVTQSIIH